MLAYLMRRLLFGVVTVWIISIISFAIIQLPPGDYITSYIAAQSASGNPLSQQEGEHLREIYGLNDSIFVQYVKWLDRMSQGNFGMSFEWRRPVDEVIGDRLTMTIVVSLAAIIFTWVVALPIGIYSAVHQYSAGDYIATFIGFIGLAVPNFLIALILMYLGWKSG